MLQARPRIGSVILEDRDVVHAVVQAQGVVALFVHAQDGGHMRVRQQPHVAGMVRTVDDHFVKAETLNAPAQMLQASRRLSLAR